MAEPVVVRRLARADLEAYKALRDAMLEAHPDAFTSDAATERAKPPAAYLGRLGLDRPEGGHFTLGAFQGMALIGVISCERDERIKVRHIGHLVGMMVAPAARGAGVGRALLEACLAQVRAAGGITLLTLSVTVGNRAAERLYEQAGFTTYGTLKNAIKLGDTFLDKTLMSLTP